MQPERIKDGWYQLPGSTDYYGDDSNGSALIGAVAGVGALQDIDSACGPTGKAVYDAAQIADPEIDYNDYDTDKDGVVDFFMMVFAGARRQRRLADQRRPPYDNIWPHSSDLQGAYTDPATGEKGYVTDDQLKDLEGRPLYYTDDSRTEQTTEDTGIPVHGARRPLQRQPGVGDREGERDLARVRPLARPARLLLDRLARDLRLVDADGDRLLAEHRHRRQEGARLGRPARARARRGRRRRRLEGHEGQHPPDRLEAARRHAVLARPGRRRRQRPAPTPPRCPGARSSTRPGALRRTRVLVGLGQRLRLPAAGRPQRRHRAAGAQGRARGHAGHAHVQVPLGHRVGLRLRLRADHHRHRQDVHVARVRQGLHDAGQPERRTPTAASRPSATASPARAGPTRRARRPSTAWRAPTPPRRSSTTSTTSPTWPARRPCCGCPTPPTRGSPARAGSSTTSRSRPATASSTPRTSSPRPTRRSTTAAAARACRPRRPARTAGRASRPPTARRPSTRT